MTQFVIGNVKDLKIAQNLNVNLYVINQIAFHNNNKINVAIVLQDNKELDLLDLNKLKKIHIVVLLNDIHII